jgi:hypothetical protein
LKAGDQVVDRHGNVGEVKQVGHNFFDIDAVQVHWYAFMSDFEVPHPFVKQKYLTVVTKEVADIIRSSKP